MFGIFNRDMLAAMPFKNILKVVQAISDLIEKQRQASELMHIAVSNNEWHTYKICAATMHECADILVDAKTLLERCLTERRDAADSEVGAILANTTTAKARELRQSMLEHMNGVAVS